MSDWNAEEYNLISEPQFRWGMEVLSALELNGDETVIDAGCGSGRLTAQLLERLPKGRVIALDASTSMLDVAKRELARFGDRVTFQQADLGELLLDPVADVIFSTATFHWVMDHDALFHGLHRALKPGGRLHAQCGGAGNISKHLQLAFDVASNGPWADQLDGLTYPTYFATAEDSQRRLEAAGFKEARAWLKDAPTPFADATAFRRFISNVTLRTVVALLGESGPAFIDAVVAASAPHYSLDYVRLELRGKR